MTQQLSLPVEKREQGKPWVNIERFIRARRFTKQVGREVWEDEKARKERYSRWSEVITR